VDLSESDFQVGEWHWALKEESMAGETRPDTPSDLIYVLGKLLDFLSGEYLLTWIRYPNGGTVVFLRALHVTVVIFLGALAIVNLLDPTRGYEFSWTELGTQTLARVTWIGAIFATVYALLYARFASQWTYVAGVYNQIKSAEIRGIVNADVLAEWKAGFIEDCDDLHLVRKPMFASIAHEWLKLDTATGPLVRSNLAGHSPGGAKRCSEIVAAVDGVVKIIAKRYG
jgi:hypothetical protein